jgi:hypothetical protein
LDTRAAQAAHLIVAVLRLALDAEWVWTVSGTENQDWLFAVATPLGFSVRVSRAEWTTILAKHPDLTQRVEDIKAALAAPDEVRQSRRDAAVLLFYRQEAAVARWVVAVAKRCEEAGVLITAYRTDAVKEGKRIWPA